MKKSWVAMAGAAVFVSGVIAAGPILARLNDPGPVGTGAGAASSLGTRPVSVDRSTWAGAKQFMQVESGHVSGGLVTLNVRPAKKVVLGESFETEPIPGPYTEVTVKTNARILLLDGESGTAESFVGDLGKRAAKDRGEAFDITFDASGKVTLVEWLYVPQSAPTTGKPAWAGTKQFLQVQSGKASGGAVTLKVRPAKKVILGESFETQPIPGPFTEVTVRANARILLLDGESGTAESFVGALGKRTAQQRGEAFDVTFDAAGKVTLVEWLYVS